MDRAPKQRDKGQPEPSSGGRAASRKPYSSPELVEYGPIAKLTQGTLSRNNDGPGGGFRMTNNMGMGMGMGMG